MVCILQKGKLVKRGASGVNSHVKPVLASPQINTSNSPKAPYNILIYIHRTSIDQIRDPLGIVSQVGLTHVLTPLAPHPTLLRFFYMSHLHSQPHPPHHCLGRCYSFKARVNFFLFDGDKKKILVQRQTENDCSFQFSVCL